MTHPLTDKLIEDLWNKTSSSMVNMEDPIDTQVIRAAADWQLEQVIEQWEEVVNSNKTDIQIIREFDKRLKAMRPQEDNQ